ncbi:hypothetical protein MMC18_001319 [Xylographa bjoerkii]|nr:hypothetical protein [Xylographa bjoerkii]
MDSIPVLRPVVIPALEHKIRGKLFTCMGDGLQKNGYTYDDQVERYLPLLEPLLTKAGKVKVHQPQVRKQPQSYWKAQCVFRNLPQTGTIANLQGQLRFSDAGMDPELEELEDKLNIEFRIKNASVRDAKWNLLETLEAKAEADPRRFILEHFSQDPGTAIVLKTHRRSELHQESEVQNLFHQSVDAPHKPDGSRPDVDRWIVIGKDQSAVYDKIREISREATRARQQAEGIRQERTRKLHEQVISTTKSLGKDKAWDVTGSWTISCPDIEEQWGEGDTGCSLEVRISQSGGDKQMWAQFDFIAITGVFRFISPVPSERHTEQPQSSKSGESARIVTGSAVSQNDCRAEDDDEEENGEESDEEDEYDEFRESPTPEEFYLSTPDLPSPKYPKWNYRWRGEETGESEIQLYSDKKLCSITFGEPGGTKLVGVFDGDLTGRIAFTGLKTGVAEGRGDVDDAWHCWGEQAYENARVGRWH